MRASTKVSACVILLILAACGGEPSGEESNVVADAENGQGNRSPDGSAASSEEAAWRAARDAATPEAYTAFLEDHPGGLYAREAAARHRILELGPISLNVEISAPEGQFMQSAPPVLTNDGSIAPSRSIAAVPAGTTQTLRFSANVNGEDITEDIVTTFDEMDGDRVIFRNDDGVCIWNDPATGGIGYCESAMPAPPDPADTRALMAYLWLAVANDR